DTWQILLHLFEEDEKDIPLGLRAIPPPLHMICPCPPPHQVSGRIPLLELRETRRHRTDVRDDKIDAAGETGNRMPSGVDIACIRTERTESCRQVRLDDPRRPLRPQKRSLLHRDTLASLDPRSDRVHLASRLHQIAASPVENLVDNMLHPCRPAFHLRCDEDVFETWLIRFGLGKALHAATSCWRRDTFVLDARL